MEVSKKSAWPKRNSAFVWDLYKLGFFLLLLFSFFQQRFKLHAASQMTSGKYSAEFKAVLEKTSQVSNEPSGKTKEM